MAYDDEWRQSPEWQAVEKAIYDFVEKHEEMIPNPIVADFAVSVAMLPAQQSKWDGGYVHFCTNVMPHVAEGLLSRGAAYFSNIGEEDDG